MTLERILCVVLFIPAILLYRWFVVSAVHSQGAWIAIPIVAVCFWIGIKIENHDRALEGRPPYSWYEAGRDVREAIPDLKFWGIVLAIGVPLLCFVMWISEPQPLFSLVHSQ